MGKSAGNRGYNYRWVVWGIMVLTFMVVFFHRLAAGVVRPDLEAAFGLSAASFGSLASMYFYAYMVMQIPVGFLADSLGARLTVSAGMLLASIGSILFGLAPGQGLLFLGRFLVGIGVSTVFVSILKIQSRWFREREFATMSGLTALMGNMGGVLAQAPLAMLVTVFSWRQTFLGIGLFSIALTLACFALIRNTPEAMGLPPIEAHPEVPGKHRATTAELLKGLMTVLTSRQTWPIFIYLGCLSGIYLAFSGVWGTSFLREVYGMSATQASSYVAYSIYGTMVGAVFTGWFSDKLGKRRPPLVSMTVLSTLAWAILIFGNGGMLSPSFLKPLFFIIGFSATAYILSWALVKELQPPHISGIAMSVVNMGSFLATALISTFMGVILDRLGGLPVLTQYRAAFGLCLAASVLALACVLIIPETNCRYVGAKGD